MSVVILTKNEEMTLRPALESAAWCDDVHLLDSGSSDGTCALAASLGAHLYQRAFTSFGDQRNWAIDNIPTKHRWQFHLDADERFTPDLVEEMRRNLTEGPGASHAAFRVCGQMLFLGRRLQHAAGFPVYQVRLIDRTRCRFVDHGHGQREATTGTIGTLTHPLVHEAFAKGLRDWFDKHNRYSTLEGAQCVATWRAGYPRLGSLLDRDGVQRRRALKELAAFLPARDFFRFAYSYVLKRGFLDGRAGFHYSVMISVYERWITLKAMESLRQWRQDDIRIAARLLSEGPS